MTDISKIPFHGTTIVATEIDGVPHVAVKPVCEAIGIDFSGQNQKLKRQPWATVVMTPTVGRDGKNREMSMVDRRTFTMWLATIETSRVKNETARELLTAFQREAADALDQYFNEGAVINPRLAEHRVNAAIRHAQMRMELIQAAKGIISPDHLAAHAEAILAQGLGTRPQIEAATAPLYAQDFLREKNLSSTELKKVAGTFGKRVKAAYMLEYGTEPHKYPLSLPNCQVRKVNAYTEADRPLLERIWNDYYETRAAA